MGAPYYFFSFFLRLAQYFFILRDTARRAALDIPLRLLFFPTAGARFRPRFLPGVPGDRPAPVSAASARSMRAMSDWAAARCVLRSERIVDKFATENASSRVDLSPTRPHVAYHKEAADSGAARIVARDAREERRS